MTQNQQQKVCCERALALTSWTQTQEDDFPSKINLEAKIEELEGHIYELGENIKIQNEVIKMLREEIRREEPMSSVVDHTNDEKIGMPITPEPDVGNNLVAIGPNNTKVLGTEFHKISWKSASTASRKLLSLIFDRETLATHSMTGKASPAFKDLNKPFKGKLCPNAVQDIMHIVSTKCKVSKKECMKNKKKKQKKR